MPSGWPFGNVISSKIASKLRQTLGLIGLENVGFGHSRCAGICSILTPTLFVNETGTGPCSHISQHIVGETVVMRTLISKMCVVIRTHQVVIAFLGLPTARIRKYFQAESPHPLSGGWGREPQLPSGRLCAQPSQSSSPFLQRSVWAGSSGGLQDNAQQFQLLPHFISKQGLHPGDWRCD